MLIKRLPRQINQSLTKSITHHINSAYSSYYSVIYSTVENPISFTKFSIPPGKVRIHLMKEEKSAPPSAAELKRSLTPFLLRLCDKHKKKIEKISNKKQTNNYVFECLPFSLSLFFLSILFICR